MKQAATADLLRAGKTGFFSRLGADLKRNKAVYLIMLPGLLYYLIFHYLPMFGLVMAFQDYSPTRGFFGSEFVGLQWFKDFFSSVFIGRIVKNTLVLNGLILLFGFPMPIILALLLNEVRHAKFKKTVQTVTYLPHFISLVVLCGMIVDFTGPGGFITAIVNKLTGGGYTNLLYESGMYRPIYVISNIWQTMGWSSIVYLAALAGLDMELYEAASIDGASRWKQLWKITIPSIMPTIAVMLVLQIGRMMSLGADKTILIYNESIYETADIISSFIYRYGLVNNNYGYSAAVGLINSVVNTILVFGANKLSNKFAGSGVV